MFCSSAYISYSSLFSEMFWKPWEIHRHLLQYCKEGAYIYFASGQLDGMYRGRLWDALSFSMPGTLPFSVWVVLGNLFCSLSSSLLTPSFSPHSLWFTENCLFLKGYIKGGFKQLKYKLAIVSFASCPIIWIVFYLARSVLGTILNSGGKMKTWGSKSLPPVGILSWNCTSVGPLSQGPSLVPIQWGGPFPLVFEVFVGQDLNEVSF